MPAETGAVQAPEDLNRAQRRLLNRGRALSTSDVADLTGHDVRTVQRWVADGQLRGVRLGRKAIRIFEEDLEEFINSRVVGGAA